MTIRGIAPLTFPDIEPGGAVAARPRYAEVNPVELLVDDDYQRNLSERSRSLIRRLIANWDWRAFKPPNVVETNERVVFGVLVARKLATKDAILAALYRSLGRDEAAPRIVDVFVCKLRKKITPFGVAVRTAWGSGYYVDDEVRLRFQEAV